MKLFKRIKNALKHFLLICMSPFCRHKRLAHTDALQHSQHNCLSETSCSSNDSSSHDAVLEDSGATLVTQELKVADLVTEVKPKKTYKKRAKAESSQKPVKAATKAKKSKKKTTPQ